MTERKKCLYTIEFSDGSIYVGITSDMKRRISQHKMNGQLKDKMNNTTYKVTRTDYCLTNELAAKEEKKEIKKHQELGSNLLNRDSGGSIGYTLPLRGSPKKSVTMRMPENMIEKLSTESEELGINFSALVIEIIAAQLNGKTFSKIDFLLRKTFRTPKA